MTVVDMVATETHYIDHLAGVWARLPEANRGAFVCPGGASAHARHLGIVPKYDRQGDVVVTASWSDMAGTHGYRKRVLLEHGVGQTYQELEWQPHYAGGGPNRDIVDMFLSPNERCRRINERAHPGALHETVGSPYLDLLQVASDQAPRSERVAFTFHWDGSDLCPEMGNGFRWVAGSIPVLADRWELLGHAHPRLYHDLRPWYEQHEIPAVWWFGAVAGLAQVLVCDNSSALYLFAALGKPVVVLNPPIYRRDVYHGLRFWEFADVGPSVDEPRMLAWQVDEALHHDRWADRRLEVSAALFPYRCGVGAARAVAAILAL